MFQGREPTIRPYGVKGFSSKFQAYLSAPQLIPNNVNTRINFDAVQFDILDEYDEAVLYQFVPNRAGYYHLETGLVFGAMAGGVIYGINLMVNLLSIKVQTRVTVGGMISTVYASRLWYLVPTDTVWTTAIQVSGFGVNLTAGITSTWLEGFRIG